MRAEIAQPTAKTIVTQLELVGLRGIAEILHSNKKSGSANRTTVSKFTPEVHK